MFEVFNEKKAEEQSAAPSSSEHDQSAQYAPQQSYSAGQGKLFAISVGGSILVGDKPNTTMIAKLSESISSLHREGHRFALVVGGGKACRSYVSAARAMGANNFFQDEIGIAFTRINAALLCRSIEIAHPNVLTKITHARHIIDRGNIPIYGGLLPGITTDAVAALLAESLGGTFINLSNVDGIYSADPKKNANAKFYDTLSHERLASMMKMYGSQPAQNVVLDVPASLILQRSKIRSLFMNGNDLSNFESAIRGQSFKGTVVSENVAEEAGIEEV